MPAKVTFKPLPNSSINAVLMHELSCSVFCKVTGHLAIDFGYHTHRGYALAFVGLVACTHSCCLKISLQHPDLWVPTYTSPVTSCCPSTSTLKSICAAHNANGSGIQYCILVPAPSTTVQAIRQLASLSHC